MCDYNISADSCADRCCMGHDVCCEEGYGTLTRDRAAYSHCNREMIECLQACSCEPNPGNCLLDEILPVPATAIVGAMGLVEDWCCSLPCPGQPAFDSSSYGHLSTAVAEVLSENVCPEASSSFRTDRFDGFMLGLAFWILLFGVGGLLFYVWHRSLLAAMQSARQELDTLAPVAMQTSPPTSHPLTSPPPSLPLPPLQTSVARLSLSSTRTHTRSPTDTLDHDPQSPTMEIRFRSRDDADSGGIAVGRGGGELTSVLPNQEGTTSGIRLGVCSNDRGSGGMSDGGGESGSFRDSHRFSPSSFRSPDLLPAHVFARSPTMRSMSMLATRLGRDERLGLCAVDLSCQAPGGKPILHRITMHANPGEMLALMGPSGCGKVGRSASTRRPAWAHSIILPLTVPPPPIYPAAP